ncbi:poly-gamma-glutamate synthase PgsB [Streptomyces sp. NEAU-W12]|uniref:poly-gamma-glutamate synthase PgsB n=1 Tax=Streptomyces sp. NEAU-W12 TaxID=2994668 RepID=UPI00224A8646|nr:poly-gamma-glutamate synthase PgsB [Streptomyces sp. NEAU-W12]MCX2926490.1 poly-gamma-glutamate synthase PgsB [Streptomyces sp. NEAU-W12]
MLYLYFALLICCLLLFVAGVVEQRRHYAALHSIPSRVLVNGIRGKSSITRLCAGALRGGDLTTVAKTTGTAARFIHPDATEEPVYRKFGIANVVEQIGIVRRAAAYRPDALVIECMAVMPALQEVNQSKLIRSTIGVLCNVREDHLAEMGPTLDDVARSLCRSMPQDGICVTAEKDRFDILQEEADARNCKLIYADPEMVTDEELRGFSWFTFKENVAIALVVAELLGVEREVALQGMYDAPPDPGVLSVEKYVTEENKRLSFANVFAANDPESTLMNINQLLDLGAIRRPLNVVINCRPDRVERNGQMGEIVPDLQPDNVFVIGHPAKSAIDAIPAEWRDRAVDLGGERRDAHEFMTELLGRMSDGSSLVAIGNIHGQGEELLEYLAELPADETPDADQPAGPGQQTGPGPAARGPAAVPAQQVPRLDPFAAYPTAYEERYQASRTQEIPVIRRHLLARQAALQQQDQQQGQQQDQYTPYAPQDQYEQRGRYQQHAQHERYEQRDRYAEPGQYEQRRAPHPPQQAQRAPQHGQYQEHGPEQQRPPYYDEPDGGPWYPTDEDSGGPPPRR